MSGIIAERRLSLTKLAQRENVNTSTVWRWAQKGVRGIHLETYRIGGRRFTSEEAFCRFVTQTTDATKSQDSVCQRSSDQQQEVDPTE